MAKQADKEQIAKFRKDAKFLLSLYTRMGMAKQLGEQKGNFSNYVNGRKKPSTEKIDLFYDIYGKDLERFGKEVPEKLSVVEELPEPYGVDYTADLKSIKDDLSLIKDLLTNRQEQQDITELRSRLEKIENRLASGNDQLNT